MRLFLNLLFLPIRIIITVLIWTCALIIRLSGRFFGLASGLLALLGLAVLTYSVENALMVFALALFISPIGLPMITVSLLSLLNRFCRFLCFG